jgi:hypothetical protein
MEEKVKIINNSSYHHQKPHMTKEQNDNNIYPCVYSVMKKETKFWFSDTNTKGHFGESKLIWGNGRVISVGSQIDVDGKYGLTEFCSGIVDTPENLPRIKEAFDSRKFRELMQNCTVSDMSINYKVIALFRKDFWKDFI